MDGWNNLGAPRCMSFGGSRRRSTAHGRARVDLPGSRGPEPGKGGVGPPRACAGGWGGDEEALSAHRRAGDIFRELGDRPPARSMTLEQSGDRAAGAWGGSRRRSRPPAGRGDMSGVGDVRRGADDHVNNLGLALQYLGGSRRRSPPTSVPKICRELGDPRGEGQAWKTRLALRGTGQTVQARLAWRRAAGLFEDLGDDHEAGIVRGWLAELNASPTSGWF